MKTELNIEESARLIELGVDAKLASSNYVGRWVHYSTGSFADPDSVESIFTLTDILSILPKEIEYDGLTYGLNIWVDSAIWYVEYCAEKGVYDFLVESNIDAPELIDALNSLLIWCLTEKKINSNTENQ